MNDKDSLDIPLHIAIRNNDNILVNLLLEDKGACINVKNCREETALHISSEKDNFEISKFLLETDSTIADLTDIFSNTALHFAVDKDCLKIVELLLSYEVNINAYTEETWYKRCTPLHILIMKKNQEIVKLLLTKGADIEAIIGLFHISKVKVKKLYIKYEHFKPIHLVVAINDCYITELLINHNANVSTVVQDNGMTPVHIAVENKNMRIVNLFSQCKCDSNFKAKTTDGKNVLHMSIENNWYEGINTLLDRGADVNEMTNTGETPLHMAAKHNKEIVDILLNRGAEIDKINYNDETALYVAVKYSKLDVINKLLKYNPSIQNKSNKAAFLYAIKNYNCKTLFRPLLEYGFSLSVSDVQNDKDLLYHLGKKGYKEIVQNLLTNGLNICSDPEYQFFLHEIIMSKQFKMAELLIKFKCPLNSVNNDNRVPIDYAIMNKDFGTFMLLVESGAKVDKLTNSILHAAAFDDDKWLQVLLSYGANINVSNEFGTTPLHFAVWHRNYSLAKLLLTFKADVNTIESKNSMYSFIMSKDIDRKRKQLQAKNLTSPLHVAVYRQNTEIIRLLLEHHANVNLQDGLDKTALHIACSVKSHDQEFVIQTLLRYGADINAVDYNKKVPFYYTYENECICSNMQLGYKRDSECYCITAHSDYNSQNVTAVFIKHIALLIAMNQEIHKKNLEILSLTNFSKKLKNDCLLEIKRMKQTKISKGVTYFDILVKKPNVLAKYALNEKIQQVFQSDTYKLKYPLYSQLLHNQFDSITERKKKLNFACSSFTSFVKGMPHHIIENIFIFLNNTDLDNIRLSTEFL